nr:MAG TPA: hypothetical protein [Caudoviricetes sp.]
MAAKRESFVYHLSWEEVLDNLPEEVREEVRGGIIGYARTGVAPELKPLAKVAFEFVKRDMDWDFQKYQTMVANRVESGKKGAATREANASIAKQNQANQASASFAKQTKQAEANQAVYDNDNDNVTQCVCDNSAQARAREHNTPHTEFDFYFPIFWKRNIIAAEAETRRFLDFYEAAGWILEKGAKLDTDAKRLAKARQWKPEKPGKRFPEDFLKVWWQLAQAAPTEEIRGQMLCDRVAVDMAGTEPVVRIGEATHAWIMGEGRSIAEKALAGDWLKGRVRLKFRAY